MIRTRFIDYQKNYGAGYAMPSFEYYGPDGFFEEDIDGDGTLDKIVPTLEDGSMAHDSILQLNVYHSDSFVPESPNYNKAYPWVAAKDTPVDFFETQVAWNNSVALSGGNDVNTFRLSYTNFDLKGNLPNQDQKRHTLSFNGTSQITKNFWHPFR